MINEEFLKKELAARILKNFVSNGNVSVEDLVEDAKVDEKFIQNLTLELIGRVKLNPDITEEELAEEIIKMSAQFDNDENDDESDDELDDKDAAQIKNFTAAHKADILIEALPYIQEFYGKTIVIKYGGNAMLNDDLKEKVMQDVALMKYVGIKVVIVHGGGPEITQFLKKVGKESSFVSGLRVTDEETVEIAEMVLDGKINSEIVTRLNRRGLRAVGLSGKDAGLIQAEKKLATVYEQGDKVKVDIGYVGKCKKVDTRILEDLISRDYVPVIAPIGVGEDGESYNINADYVAADIAGALRAEKLLLLTDTDGVYKNFGDKESFVSTLTANEAREFIREGIISGGMIPKVEACLHALQTGANKAHIIDGRLPHSIILELFTAAGIGTQVV